MQAVYNAGDIVLIGGKYKICLLYTSMSAKGTKANIKFYGGIYNDRY